MYSVDKHACYTPLPPCSGTLQTPTKMSHYTQRIIFKLKDYCIALLIWS